jgi:hypothetical protein
MHLFGARYDRVIAAIDAANARCPRMTGIGGRQEPAELVYGRRMSKTLARMVAEPSECLCIAARGQHIERWLLPRNSRPPGRAGYLQWRKDQRAYQAMRLGEIMAPAGYGGDAIGRVGALIRKENMKTDSEVQTFEDVICVMFFAYYLRDFVDGVDEEKLAGILVKTWGRMSELGHRHALMLDLPPVVTRLLERELGALASAA